MNTLYTLGDGPCFITGDDFIRAPSGCLRLLNGLVAHWRLEEASGVRMDAHGANDLGEINAVGQAAGKLGNAASFVATNEAGLGVPESTELSMGNIDFTLAGWVRLDSLADGGLIGKWGSGSLEYLVLFDGTHLSFHVSSNGTSQSSVANSAGISANTWYFFVAWHDAANDTINISVNNNAAASAAHTTGVHDGDASFYLGRNEEGGTWLNGRLDSVSIWKRLLTSGERTQLYNSGNGLDYPFH